MDSESANEIGHISFPPLNTDGSLKRYIFESRVDFVGVSDGYGRKDIRNLIQNESRGAFSYYELLYNLANESSGSPYDFIKKCAKSGQHFAILGIDAPGDDHEAMSRMAGSHTWKRGYEELNIDPNDPDRTEKYMDAVTDPKGLHLPILFVIPKNFKKYYNANETETYREFKWLLDHPKRAENVIFVFGDDLVDDNSPKLTGRTESERYQITLQAMDELMDYAEGKDKTKEGKSSSPGLKILYE